MSKIFQFNKRKRIKVADLCEINSKQKILSLRHINEIVIGN